MIRTKAELDERLCQVVRPAPRVHIGRAHSIVTWPGFNDPMPGWYLGAETVVDEDLMDDDCWVQEWDECCTGI